MFRVYIQSNAKQLLGAKVSQFSIRKASNNNPKFDIQILNLEDYPLLYGRDGQTYLREGTEVTWKNNDLQSFTPLRFLPPQLMEYEGKAIVIDPDVFALADIYDLFDRDMAGNAIVCRRIEPTDGRPPYYGSSVMLLDCEKLTHWRWDESINEMFGLKRDYRPWISLLLEPEGSIGALEEEWNHYDTLNSQTKLLHNTGRLTQPWKTGLPIDFTSKKRPKKVDKKWGLIPRPWIASTKAFLKGERYFPQGVYRKHPDPKQESFFFSLLKECLNENVFDESFLKSEIRKHHLREDAFELLEALD